MPTASAKFRPDGGLVEIVETVRRLAATEALPSERVLAERLNLKRHQLRRALAVLRARGEIEPAEARNVKAVMRHTGSLARETNPIEVVEMRIAIEPYLVRLAAMRAPALDIARILRAAKTADDTSSGAADLAFHKAIAASTGNRLGAILYAMLRQVGSDTRLRFGNSEPVSPKRIAQRDGEHHAIAAAIAARDPDAAELAMRQHMLAVQQRVLEHLKPIGEAV